MLSKDEILKKKGKSPEQLDLVKDLDVDKSKTKNRLLLLLFLILFVGSSVGLSIYRQYREGELVFNFNFAIPNLPVINPAVQGPTDKNAWEVCLFDKNPAAAGQAPIYNQNCKLTNIPTDTIKDNIDLIKSSLPNGLIVNEQISTASTELNYLSEITSPRFSYLLTIKIFGNYPLDVSQNLIPKLASDLYWSRSR